MPPSARLAVCPLLALGVSGLTCIRGALFSDSSSTLRHTQTPRLTLLQNTFHPRRLLVKWGQLLPFQTRQAMHGEARGPRQDFLHKSREGWIKYRVPWRCRVLLPKSSASRGQGKAARWTTRQDLPCDVRSLPKGLYTCICLTAIHSHDENLSRSKNQKNRERDESLRKRPGWPLTADEPFCLSRTSDGPEPRGAGCLLLV